MRRTFLAVRCRLDSIYRGAKTSRKTKNTPLLNSMSHPDDLGCPSRSCESAKGARPHWRQLRSDLRWFGAPAPARGHHPRPEPIRKHAKRAIGPIMVLDL